MGISLALNGDTKRDDAAVAMHKSLPPFLDSEETYHFFNDDVVLRTNAIRTLDEEDEAGDEAEGTMYNGDEQERDNGDDGRRGDGAAEDSESVVSEEDDDNDDNDDNDDDDYDEDEDEDEDEEDGALMIHRNAIAKCKNTRKKRKQQQQHRRMRTKITSAMLKRNSLRSERIPDPAPMYDEIYDSFDDLYVGYHAQSNDLQRKDWEQKQQNKTRRARAALAAYTRRTFAAKSYRYRKQCEFLRVCYQRALETEPLAEERAGYVGKDTLGEKCDKLVHEDGGPPHSSSSLLSGIVRKDDVVETTTPTLYPRKWPHLPFRSPLLWKDNVDDAVEFLSKLSELPETSLLYEPIDIQGFTKEVVALLEAVGVDLNMDTHGSEHKNPGTETQQLPEEAVAGLTALLGMGVQLQSFSLLSFAALHLTALGRGTLLGEARVVRPRLQNVLSMYWGRLVNYASSPSYAATYSRGLLSQWKVSACQPSSSDAIATDGLFLYVFSRSGLLKIGTGNGVTVRDFVYGHNREYTRSRDAERSWLCCIGNYLYCRTIVMPSNRVDRIDINNLNSVEELFFSPNRAIQGKGVSESSVYAMVTDGIDLYTIKCIDTHKRSIQEKKEELVKSRLSNTIDHAIDRILNSEHHKSNEKTKELSSKCDGSDIQIGDRVMRGPDWKWSNQDGEKGSFGTVERISTWGGVAGSGVTVRWDKTQRVNTYRWGAENCYDLIIVVEKDGQIIEQKKLPSKATQENEAGGNSAEEHLSPRHQFMLFRHSVSQIMSTIDLEDEDIDHFLDLTPMCSEEDDSSQKSPALTDKVQLAATLKALETDTFSNDGIENAVVKFVAAELQRVEQWMLRQVQLLNEWHYLQVDGVTVEEMTERYADNHDRLRELCELRDITYNSIDVNGCIKKLHAYLHKQDAHTKDDMTSQASAAYQFVANEIIKKAQFLMDRGMSVIANELPDAAGAKYELSGLKAAMNVASCFNRPRHDLVMVAGEFLRCSVSSAVITQCAQIQSKRLKERLAGFYLLEFALSGIETMDVRTWFVGRGLVALSSSSYFDSGYFTGCLLGDRTLMTEFAAILRKSENSTVNFLNDKQKPHALRTIALAELFCAMQLTDSSETVDGLDCAANLISSIDGASPSESMKDSDTSNIGWILYRLHHDQVYDRISSLDKPRQDVLKSKAVSTARMLYTHYEKVKTFETRNETKILCGGLKGWCSSLYAKIIRRV
uniref:MIB/HERC2 domain-containing protein n=1 Tax=Globisporangium ultimum (strain ATCC 200006 / CBS 805.95 / DAOM BR144) TaxID=431595 RepID=K3WUM2_GLOUD